MIQIIPNWHPVFVHFTVALLSLAVIFPLIDKVLNNARLKEQLQIMANWNLWLGTGFGIVTALAGWDAYNTVAHDGPSHAAMTEHLYWAISTLLVFVGLSAWTFWRVYRKKSYGVMFIPFMLLGGALLLSTAWHGGELVYRYGLGVMSLPKIETADTSTELHGEHEHAGVTLPDQKAENRAKRNLQAVTQPTSTQKKNLNSDGHNHTH